VGRPTRGRDRSPQNPSCEDPGGRCHHVRPRGASCLRTLANFPRRTKGTNPARRTGRPTQSVKDFLGRERVVPLMGIPVPGQSDTFCISDPLIPPSRRLWHPPPTAPSTLYHSVFCSGGSWGSGSAGSRKSLSTVSLCRHVVESPERRLPNSDGGRPEDNQAIHGQPRARCEARPRCVLVVVTPGS